MKKYYTKNTLGFANTYAVVYAETDAEQAMATAEGYEQITRKEAVKLCRAEREREQFDSAFSGYADSVILPISYPVDRLDWRNDPRMRLNGCIVERV